MLPSILRESDENRSYWKGHVLLEVLQSERKQASEGKERSLCKMTFSHLIKGWQQGGCIQQLYPFTSVGMKAKIEEEFSIIEEYHPLHQILQNMHVKAKF